VGLEVAAIIRERAGRLDVKQADIAQATGLNKTRVSRVCRGTYVSTVDELALIARALEMDAGRVLDDAIKVAAQHATISGGGGDFGDS